MPRDRDVRIAIQAALQATNQFDGVYLWGLPEDLGSGVSRAAIAVIEPGSGQARDDWDDPSDGGQLVIESTASVTLYQREEDPQLRDENAELLLSYVANAINGQSLGGLTLPGATKVQAWRWNPPTPPDRTLTLTVSYQYFVDGWTSFDTTP